MPKKKPKNPKAQPLSAVPDPPADLPPAGKDYWRRLAPQLVEHAILTELHMESFRVLCELWNEYRSIADFLRDNPKQVTFVTKSGYESESPKVRMRDKALAGLQKLWPKFGLTPQALAQLNKHSGARSGKLSKIEAFAASKYAGNTDDDSDDRGHRRKRR